MSIIGQVKHWFGYVFGRRQAEEPALVVGNKRTHSSRYGVQHLEEQEEIRLPQDVESPVISKRRKTSSSSALLNDTLQQDKGFASGSSRQQGMRQNHGNKKHCSDSQQKNCQEVIKLDTYEDKEDTFNSISLSDSDDDVILDETSENGSPKSDVDDRDDVEIVQIFKPNCLRNVSTYFRKSSPFLKKELWMDKNVNIEASSNQQQQSSNGFSFDDKNSISSFSNLAQKRYSIELSSSRCSSTTTHLSKRLPFSSTLSYKKTCNLRDKAKFIELVCKTLPPCSESNANFSDVKDRSETRSLIVAWSPNKSSLRSPKNGTSYHDSEISERDAIRSISDQVQSAKYYLTTLDKKRLIGGGKRSLPNIAHSQRTTVVPLNRRSVPPASVIDLTSSEDDDEIERQKLKEIISKKYDLDNSGKSSLLSQMAKKELTEIGECLRNYESRRREGAQKVEAMKKALAANQKEFNDTLCEIIRDRLTLKEHEFAVPEDDLEKVKGIRPKATHELAPLTDKMLMFVKQMMAQRSALSIRILDSTIKYQDIITLLQSNWLNDEVVNGYMNLIRSRWLENKDSYPSVYCFNTFFYQRFSDKKYEGVRRWTKKVNIFDHEMALVPIHLGNHWCLAQILFKEKTIRYFDSLGSDNQRCLKMLLQYLADESQTKRGISLDTKPWTLTSLPPDVIPQQGNMNDCGVFACTFGEHLSRRAPFQFDQSNMTYYRNKMMYELITAKLLL